METPPAQHELPLKRPSKGFRACFECKRAKLTADSSSSFDGEASPPDIPTPSSSHVTTTDEHCPLHIRGKLSKLEALFERFACRRIWTPPPSSSQAGSAADSESEKPLKGDFQLPEIEADSKSILSDGESILSGTTLKWNDTASIRTLPGRGAIRGADPDAEAIRRSLLGILPSQHDADLIFAASHGWTIFSCTYQPNPELFVNQDPSTLLLDMSAVAKENVIVIARTLLHFAICISTLPPEFDASPLQHRWCREGVRQSCISTVTALILSSDEQMCTLPGLEALSLLSRYQYVNCNLRHAWLTIRRALNLAHLMGLHRVAAHPITSPGSDVIENARFVWRQLVDVDRFLGLHLRLPFASDDYPSCPYFSSTLTHRAKLDAIARQIHDLDHAVTPQSYASALVIDEGLDSLMKSLNKSYWDIPTINATNPSSDTGEDMIRVGTQIWHFELKIMLHLPFLLRAPGQQRFEYSKITALQAARNVILRWLALRAARATQACSRIADLPTFIATATMTLDILIEMGTKNRVEVQRTRGADFAMVCRVVGEMEKLARGSPREVIAKRSVLVLKRLLCCLDCSRPWGKVRVTMPYIGTVELSQSGPPQRPSDGNSTSLSMDWSQGAWPAPGPGHPQLPGLGMGSGSSGLGLGAGKERLPVFSFVSTSLWPTTTTTTTTGSGTSSCVPNVAVAGISCWEGVAADFDVTLFEGLEDMDVDGNWTF